MANAAAPPPRWRDGEPTAGVALVAGLALLLALPADVQTGLAAALMVAGGLPHGASDHAVAGPHWRSRFGRAGVPLFLASYLGCAALVFAGWQAAPLAALLAFLALSAWHFSAEDTVGSSPVERAARGLMPIGLPALLHRAELRELLTPMLAGSVADARAVATVMTVCGGAGIVALTVWWWREGRVSPPAALSAVALLACPPLLGFALYFTFDHSRRAAGKRRASLGLTLGGYARACAPFVVGGAAVLALGAWWLPGSGLAGWLVIGLAALTVPHMILVPDGPDALS